MKDFYVQTHSTRLFNNIGAVIVGLVFIVLGLLIPENEPYYTHWIFLTLGVSAALTGLSSLAEGKPGNYTLLSLILSTLSLASTGAGVYYTYKAFVELLPRLLEV